MLKLIGIIHIPFVFATQKELETHNYANTRLSFDVHNILFNFTFYLNIPVQTSNLVIAQPQNKKLNKLIYTL